jgi:glutathione S-transferase
MTVVTDSRATLASELERIEMHLPSAFLCGDAVCAADFALYPLTAILLRVAKRAPQLELDELLGQKTRAWRDRIEALPNFAKTIPPHWQGA